MDRTRFFNKIFSPSIDTSRPSRHPHRSFRSQLRCQKPHSGSLYCHRLPILSLNLTTEQDAMRKPLLIQGKKLTKLNDFCCFLIFFFLVFWSNSHGGGVY